MLPTNRPPTHPGEILFKDFLEPANISQKRFSEHLGWTYARLNEIINERRNITADSALALGEAFKMEPDFWLNLQKNWDLWQAQRKHTCILPFILPKNLANESVANKAHRI